MTIVEAVIEAFNILDREACVDELYDVIIENNFFEFNTPDPKHVLNTAIRRQTKGVDRVDVRDQIIFESSKEGFYKLMKSSNMTRRKIGAKRIQRAADKEEFLQELMNDKVGIFKDIWRVLLFASQVGIKNRAREEIVSAESGKSVDQYTFGNCPSWPGILYLMCLTENEKTDLLKSSADAENMRIKLFQEYANGGLGIMKNYFKDQELNIENFISFVNLQYSESKPVEIDLKI